MSKMTKPTVDVVRFTESDVIVASGYTGKTMTISGLGNRSAGDGTFYNSWTSSDIFSTPAGYVSQMNDYLGTNYKELKDFKVGNSNIYDLANSDYNSADESNGGYNGEWAWNGSSFVRQ